MCKLKLCYHMHCCLTDTHTEQDSSLECSKQGLLAILKTLNLKFQQFNQSICKYDCYAKGRRECCGGFALPLVASCHCITQAIGTIQIKSYNFDETHITSHIISYIIVSHHSYQYHITCLLHITRTINTAWVVVCEPE